MRINCHAHIFNLQSVLTSQTLETFINRLQEIDMPDFLLEILKKQLAKLIGKVDGYTDEEKWIRDLIKMIKESNEFTNIQGDLNDSDFEVLKINNVDGLEELAISKLIDFFKWLGEHLQNWDDDAKNTTIWDVVDFIRTGIQPSVRKVTQNLMEQLDDDSGIIALMMDITKDGSEKDLFEQQTADTSNMVLTYPGRIFPFFAVNPIRADHHGLMTKALTERGFVGVKLYPSLGYDIASDAMWKIFDYCAQNEVPITVHSTNKGFRFNSASGDKADPGHWEAILTKDKYSKLKVCFAHFGGDKAFVEAAFPGNTWTAKVVDLMRRFPNIYADISYHTEAMESDKKREHYITNLRSLMADASLSKRILFGTDFFLVRARATDKTYWKYYSEHLGDLFDPLSISNPIAFLGLPANGAAASFCINKYVEFVYANKDKIESAPAAWLQEATKAKYGPDATIALPGLGTRWDWNRKCHYRTWSFMRDGQIPPPDDSDDKFDQSGMVPMRLMSYWNREFEYKNIWLLKLDDMAKQFDCYLIANGIAPSSNYANHTKRLVKLREAFNKRDLLLYELAEFIDPIYKFDQKART